ncbi:MAG: cobaltochelatase subunit CobT, partial [Alphaproteobacteria bacterium]|nr:cobaltochelatase subunit CobT [Alphaproteobacteria bacterium]
MSDDQSPVEHFKQATSATLRAIAERDDIEVTFSNEPLGVTGTRARVPFPSRDLPAEDVAMVRGESDAVALKLRYHDPEIHARKMPGGDVAPVLFEALEQARVEAIGARRMVGVGENLASALEQQYRRQGLHRVTERTEATLPEVVRLMARERLTGKPPPPAARQIYEQWASWLKGKVGRDLARLEECVDDQSAYGEAVRQLISDLDIDLGADSSADQQDGSEDTDDEAEAEGTEEGGDATGETGDAMTEMLAGEGGDDDLGEMSPEDELGDMMPMSGSEEPGDPGTPWHSPHDLSNVPRKPFYSAYTDLYDEVVPAETLCDPEELARLRQLLDQQLVHLQGLT